MPLSAEAEQAFTALKNAMCQAPVLKYFDATHEIELFTDASSITSGDCLAYARPGRPRSFLRRRRQECVARSWLECVGSGIGYFGRF